MSSTPSSDAAASNRRPQEVVSGPPRRASSAPGARRGARTGARFPSPRPSACSEAAAHAPGLARRRVAAGQRQRAEVAEAAERGAVETEKLAAPGAAVGAAPQPVQHDGERRGGHAVLGENGGGVGVVVLHGQSRQAEPLHETAGREVGVQVVRQQDRRRIEQVQQMAHRLVEEAQGGGVVERADVRR